MTFALWPLSKLQRTVTSPVGLQLDHDGALRTNSWPKRMSFEPGTNTDRVHSHTVLTEETAAETFVEVGQGSLERLLPGFAEDSAQQATLSAGRYSV